MGEATPNFFLQVLDQAVSLLEKNGVDYLLIGSLATACLLGHPWNSNEDADLLIRRGDANSLLDVFLEEGFSIHRRDERWIYKAARPDVTIDLVFRAGERIELDDEHLARSIPGELDGVRVRIPSAEDLAVMKAVFDGEDRPGRWYGSLEILHRRDIDWGYVAERGGRHAPDRILSLLLYARSSGIDVPGSAIRSLAKHAIG